jgi:hypothetical protein
MSEIKSKEDSLLKSDGKRIPLFKQKAYDYSNLDFKTFKYHWANASSTMGNNIERYTIAGYQQVMDSKGKPMRRTIGRHEEGYQYLMCIKKELFEEDKKEKLKIPTQIEEDMGKGRPSGAEISGLSSQYMYGGVKITSEKGR